MHKKQVHRDPWPKFDDFEPDVYPLGLRRRAAVQWMRRAREELGSVYEFTALSHVLSQARVPVEVLGGLSRLITDEVRHAEMCGRMARACYPEGLQEADSPLAWKPPRMPYDEPPRFDAKADDLEPTLRWAADVVMTSCCIGETISRPLFEAVATVTTDPVCEQVIRQILRDEHLHAAFGWDTLELLYAELGVDSRAWLQHVLANRLAGFEMGCSGGIQITDLVDTEVTIQRSTEPNLGALTTREYAQIFYSTLETDIFPRFTALGMDPMRAWAERGIS
jgi:hypothetical protein